MGMSDEEFISEKIRRTTVQRDFRPVGIREENGDPQIEFSPLDAIAFANLLLSQALLAENHSHASVTVRCPIKAGERIQIMSRWIDAETTQEADTVARVVTEQPEPQLK